MATRPRPNSSLERLAADVRACTTCADALSPRPVIQVGRNARVVIIGQAPSKTVHETGVPWDDASGDRLRDWLGVDRATFYDADQFALIPMGFCYPGAGRSGDLPPRSECAPQWHPRLLAALPKLSLTLLVGQYSQAFYLAERRGDSLTETVKAWERFGPRLVPLPHPSPRNRLFLKRNPWFEATVLPALRTRVARALR